MVDFNIVFFYKKKSSELFISRTLRIDGKIGEPPFTTCFPSNGAD